MGSDKNLTFVRHLLKQRQHPCRRAACLDRVGSLAMPRRLSESPSGSFLARLCCGRCSRQICFVLGATVAIGWVTLLYLALKDDTPTPTQLSRLLVVPRPLLHEYSPEIELCTSQCLQKAKKLDQPADVIEPPDPACACPVCGHPVGEPDNSIKIDSASSSKSGTSDSKNATAITTAEGSTNGTASKTPPTKAPAPMNATGSENVTQIGEAATEPVRIETLVCFATFAVGGYYRFLEGFFDSSEEFLFTSEPSVDYRLYAFINVRPERVNRDLRRPKVKYIYRPKLGHPYDTMLRSEGLFEMRNLFIYDCDYVYAIDCDFEWIRELRLERIQGDLVAARHVGWGAEKGLAAESYISYEENSTSAAYIPEEAWPQLYYYMGGLYGGKPSRALHLWNHTTQWAKQDMAVGIIPKWHDETILNKYFYVFPPTRELLYDFATFHQTPRNDSVLNHRKKTDEMLGWRSPAGLWEP